MLVKVNCESDRIESPDAVASLFAHGVMIATPRAESSTEAQNGTTYVLEFEYSNTKQLVDDAFSFCALRQQDCIAVKFEDGTGAILGPRAKAWEAFNPAYFVE